MRDFRYIFPGLWLLLLLACAEQKPEQKPVEDDKAKKEEKIKVDQDNRKTILFFGNSLTAGMGLDPNSSFPALIQNKLDSIQQDYVVINSGLSGETTASGKNRLNWVLKQKVDIFVLELGANDGLRGIPLQETRANLQAIIDQVKKTNPEVTIILAGMMIPPNMGQEYTTEFKDIFPDLAKRNQLLLIPFILDGVAGDPSLNLEDGIHPNVEGHRIVAENVWEILKTAI